RDARTPELRLVRKPRAERPAGEFDDLERAHESATVARADRLGGSRVDVAQPPMQRPGSARLEFRLESGSHLGIGARELEVVEDARDVEAAASDEDRDAVPLEDVVDHATRLHLVAGDARLIARLEDVEQVVRDPASLLG